MKTSVARYAGFMFGPESRSPSEKICSTLPSCGRWLAVYGVDASPVHRFLRRRSVRCVAGDSWHEAMPPRLKEATTTLRPHCRKQQNVARDARHHRPKGLHCPAADEQRGREPAQGALPTLCEAKLLVAKIMEAPLRAARSARGSRPQERERESLYASIRM